MQEILQEIQPRLGFRHAEREPGLAQWIKDTTSAPERPGYLIWKQITGLWVESLKSWIKASGKKSSQRQGTL